MPKKRKSKKSASGRRKNSFLTRVLLIINLGFVLLLLTSLLSSRISPEWSIVPALLGLAYPFIALINLTFVLIWLILFRLYFLISLCTLILGYGQFLRHFQVRLPEASTAETKALSVMTFNVRMFDFFDWKGDQQNKQEMLEKIEAAAPDILCLQEFYNNHQNPDNLRKEVRAKGGFSEDHIAYQTERREHAYGIATFTRLPVLHKEEIILPAPSPPALLTDVLYGQDTLRIFNMHLVSYYFAQDDYFFFQRLVSEQDTRDFKRATRNLLSKLKKGFIIRARQAHTLRKYIDASPYPVLICGDFNDTPASYAYRVLSRGMKDAFMESGQGMGRTYKGTFPSYRIDFVLYSPDFKASNFTTQGSAGSDHKSILSILQKQ